MTATIVHGLEVITSEPVKSPLSKPSKPIFFNNILELLLTDGSTIYGCRYCDFTSNKVGQVRMHVTQLHKEGTGTAERATTQSVTPTDPAVPELMAEETTVEFEGDWDADDLLAALEVALRPDDPKITELEQQVKAAEAERDWWKTEAERAISTLAAVEKLVREKAK